MISGTDEVGANYQQKLRHSGFFCLALTIKNCIDCLWYSTEKFEASPFDLWEVISLRMKCVNVHTGTSL